MKLPNELQEEIRSGGGGDAVVAVRALYDLEGQPGETWATSDGTALWLFSRRLGESHRQHRYALRDLDALAVRHDGLSTGLDVRSTEANHTLRFCSWDEPDLERLVQLWSRATGRIASEPPVPGEQIGSASLSAQRASEPAPELTPLTAFCAGIRAMMECDSKIGPVDMHFLNAAVPDPDAVQAGIRFLGRHGLEALLARLPTLMNEPQRQCLLANLIAVGLEDGFLRGSEQALLERFRAALDVSPERYRRMLEILIAKDDLSVLAATGAVRLSLHRAHEEPPALFGAALLLMMQADGTISDEEYAILSRVVRDPGSAQRAADLVAYTDRDELLRQLGQELNLKQQRCLLANLLAVAMVDGVLRSTEQEFLDEVRASLSLGEQEFNDVYEVMMTRNRLAVFA